jgi:LmbE family N-acetylglucosaminyl deacetylase
VLVAVAHPDDETFGTGSVIAHAANQGAQVTVLCATRGEAGEDTSGTTSGPEELARVREGELRSAASLLGASEVVVLDFADSGFDGPMPAGALADVPIDDVVTPIAQAIARIEPDIVVCFDAEYVRDHRDHIRMGDATPLAFADAAKPGAQLYGWTLPRSLMQIWQANLKELGLLEAYTDIELGRPDELVTTKIDVSYLCDKRWAAIQEHKTQTSPFHGLPPELRARFLSTDHFVRLVPEWRGGSTETSLFGAE